MSDELGELEDLTTPILELAAGYGRAGLRVFPVDMRPDDRGKPRKSPLHGYLWKERATSKITEIVEDVLEAIERIGEANVGIGWALGLDGCLALDLDGDEPSWWTDLLPADVAVNVTARGLHLIYRQPDGRRIGNGTAGFPSRGWGEVRGHGGYVVVAGPDRPGFDVAQLKRVVPFPRPEWLSDAGAEAIELDDAELEAWLEERSDGVSLPGKIAGYRTRLERWRAPESRHDTALEVACWQMREAAAELVNAAEALDVLGAWWLEVARLPGRKLTLRELGSVIRWAVGVTIADPGRVAELRARDLYLEVPASELLGSSRLELVESRLGFRPIPDPFEVPEVEWHALELLASPTHGELAGPEKSLKSYLGLTLDIGLAAGVDVLGHFAVAAPQRVLVLAGEGGEVVYLRRLAQVARGYGIELGDVRPNLRYSTRTMPATSRPFLAELTRELETWGPAVVHLDPWYAYHGGDVDTRNVYEQGAELEVLGDLCRSHDATLLLNNHYNRTGAKGLRRISMAGHAEWCDSWLLLDHRERPDVAGGRFRLRLDVGSRQWGGASWDVDVDLGGELSAMTWAVRPAVERDDLEADDEITTTKLDLLRAGRRARRALTRKAWLARVKVRAELKREAFDELLERGEIVVVGAVKSGVHTLETYEPRPS